MVDRERRQDKPAVSAALRAQLNDDQLMTLRDLERFGWELKFVRRPPFQDAIPVVFDGDRRTFAVLRADGTLDEQPELVIR
jgi:hypothetical protein